MVMFLERKGADFGFFPVAASGCNRKKRGGPKAASEC